MKPYILLSILFSILLQGCASAPKADKAPEIVDKSAAAAADTKTAAAPVATAVPAATMQKEQPSQSPAQSAEAGIKPKAIKEVKIIDESAIKGPPIIPAMVRVPGKNYEMGKYEVTQAEWVSVMGINPSKFKSCGDNCPVEKVSWDDVQVFIQRLNEKTGKQFRLPTEAEWEYACLGGYQDDYCGGNDIEAVAWTSSRGNEETHPAGQKQANAYGLFDMSGNVMEWTSDCWEGNCAQRVFRGGSWINGSMDTKVSYRIRFGTMIRNSSGGFRLARTVQ